MSKGYWIASVDVTDPEGYKDYVAANALAFARFGARFLVRGTPGAVPEGRFAARMVVIEFPSYQAALDCYHSPEYRAAMARRLGKSVMDLAIIDGYEGPQPG